MIYRTPEQVLCRVTRTAERTAAKEYVPMLIQPRHSVPNFGRYVREPKSLEGRNQTSYEPVRTLDMANELAQLGNLLLRLPVWWLFGRSRSSASQATSLQSHPYYT